MKKLFKRLDIYLGEHKILGPMIIFIAYPFLFLAAILQLIFCPKHREKIFAEQEKKRKAELRKRFG